MLDRSAEGAMTPAVTPNMTAACPGTAARAWSSSAPASAGLNAAIGAAKAPVDITVIDRRNYHLFQPLLYQVATAGLSPAQIAMPIRRILARQKNATVLMEKVEAVDASRADRHTAERRIPYDYLVVATGARHAYFGHDEWEEARRA